MVSRQETARPLLTPGEVMQLPPTDELVLVSGVRPIRASKVRFYEDRQLQSRVIAPPSSEAASRVTPAVAVSPPPNGWTKVVAAPVPVGPGAVAAADTTEAEEDTANAGIRREPELPEHEEVVPESSPVRESTSTRRTARKRTRR